MGMEGTAEFWLRNACWKMLICICWHICAGSQTVHAVFINQSTCLGFNALNYILNIISVQFCIKLQISVMQKGCEEKITKFSYELYWNVPTVCYSRGRWLLAVNQIINILFIPVTLIFFFQNWALFSVFIVGRFKLCHLEKMKAAAVYSQWDS